MKVIFFCNFYCIENALDILDYLLNETYLYRFDLEIDICPHLSCKVIYISLVRSVLYNLEEHRRLQESS